MRTGITGLAQIHGLRGDTSIEDRARFDNAYIDNWSLWQDVCILLRTAAALVPAGRGAERVTAAARRRRRCRPSALPASALAYAPAPAGRSPTVAAAGAPAGPRDVTDGRRGHPPTRSPAARGRVLRGPAAAGRGRRPLTRRPRSCSGCPSSAFAVAAARPPTRRRASPASCRYLQIFVLVPAAVVLLLRDRRDFRLRRLVARAGSRCGRAAIGVHQYPPGPAPRTWARTSGRSAPSGPRTSWAWRRWSPTGWCPRSACALGARDAPARLRLAALCLRRRCSWCRSRCPSAGARGSPRPSACAVQLLLAGLRRAVRRRWPCWPPSAVVLVGGFGVGSAMLQERHQQHHAGRPTRPTSRSPTGTRCGRRRSTCGASTR